MHMGFEPEVENRIAVYRRRARMRKAIILIPILFTSLICCFMLVNALAVHNSVSNVGNLIDDINRSTGKPVIPGHSVYFPALLIVFAVWGSITVLFLLTYYYAILQPVMRQYKFRSGSVGDDNQHRYSLFKDSLEAVSIAAGIPSPKLMVVNLATANSLTFETGDKLTVGVTPELLGADLSRHEVEAVMAHQAARISIRSGLKAPLFLSLKTVLAVACLVFILPIVTAVILGNELIIALPLLAAPLLATWTTLVVQPYLPWKRLTYYEAVNRPYGLFSGSSPSHTATAQLPSNDETLIADSLAVKITSNPGALKSAVQKLVVLMENATVMPNQTITFPYLFIGPLKNWDTAPPAGLAYRLRGFLIPKGAPAPSEKLIKSEVNAFITAQRDLLSERIDNLEAVETGEWRQFQEVSDGRVRTSAKAWE